LPTPLNLHNSPTIVYTYGEPASLCAVGGGCTSGIAKYRFVVALGDLTDWETSIGLCSDYPGKNYHWGKVYQV
jgi:hypothetical protein